MIPNPPKELKKHVAANQSIQAYLTKIKNSANKTELEKIKSHLLKNCLSFKVKHNNYKYFSKINFYFEKIGNFEAHENINKFFTLEEIAKSLKIKNISKQDFEFKILAAITDEHSFQLSLQGVRLLNIKLIQFYNEPETRESKIDKFKRIFSPEEYLSIKAILAPFRFVQLCGINFEAFCKAVKGTAYESLSFAVSLDPTLYGESLLIYIKRVLGESYTEKDKIRDFLCLEGAFDKLLLSYSEEEICKELKFNHGDFISLYKKYKKYNNISLPEFKTLNKDLIDYADQRINSAEQILKKVINRYNDEGKNKKITVDKIKIIMSNQEFNDLKFLPIKKILENLLGVTTTPILEALKKLDYKLNKFDSEVDALLKNLKVILEPYTPKEKAKLFFNLGQNVCTFFQGYYSDKKICEELGISFPTFTNEYKKYFGEFSKEKSRNLEIPVLSQRTKELYAVQASEINYNLINNYHANEFYQNSSLLPQLNTPFLFEKNCNLPIEFIEKIPSEATQWPGLTDNTASYYDNNQVGRNMQPALEFAPASSSIDGFCGHFALNDQILNKDDNRSHVSYEELPENLFFMSRLNTPAAPVKKIVKTKVSNLKISSFEIETICNLIMSSGNKAEVALKKINNYFPGKLRFDNYSLAALLETFYLDEKQLNYIEITKLKFSDHKRIVIKTIDKEFCPNLKRKYSKFIEAIKFFDNGSSAAVFLGVSSQTLRNYCKSFTYQNNPLTFEIAKKLVNQGQKSILISILQSDISKNNAEKLTQVNEQRQSYPALGLSLENKKSVPEYFDEMLEHEEELIKPLSKRTQPERLHSFFSPGQLEQPDQASNYSEKNFQK